MGSVTDYTRLLLKCPEQLKQTYMTMTNLIRDYGIAEYRKDHPIDQSKGVLITRVKVAYATGLVARSGNINMKDHIFYFDPEKYVTSFHTETYSGGSAQDKMLFINVSADQFLNRPFKLDFENTIITATLVELHLFYHFQRMLIGKIQRAAFYNGAKYGDIIYWFGQQYRLLFKNKEDYILSFRRFDPPCWTGSFSKVQCEKGTPVLVRENPAGVTILTLLDNNPYNLDKENEY